MTALEDRLICFNCETIGAEKTVSLKVRYRLLQRVENTDIFSIEIVTDMCGEKDVAFADSITASQINFPSAISRQSDVVYTVRYT